MVAGEGPIMVVEIAALDFFTLFVSYVFGSFWLAVFGLAFVIFIVMGVLGRISIFSTMWYVGIFLYTMALGYGFTLVLTIINLVIMVMFILSWKSYLDSR